jgi:dienelactone hydrolase
MRRRALTISAIVSTTASLCLVLPAVPAAAPPAVPLPAAPTARDLGDWRVRNVAGGAWEVSWRSPKRLPVGADRPVIVNDGSPVGTTALAGDGRTVTAVVTSAAAPEPADLDVMLSGDRIDVAGQDLEPGSIDTTGPGAGTLLDFDPATPGDLAVVSSDYTGDAVPIEGFENPVEFVGHVVEPALDEGSGDRPLVLFLHGRHEYCYSTDPEGEVSDWPCSGDSLEVPSQLGYDYAQRVLASQGYTTVSIRVNGINAQDWTLDDGGADARATLVRAHLDYWVGQAAEHRVDLSRVVLIGHSRGGEGVARAALQIPLSAPYRVVGAVFIAPTDFSGQAVPYIPTVTLLPYCDGDVSDLQGQYFTDAARDLAADDTALHSSVLVLGANHNFFNTEWTPGESAAPSFDDWWGDSEAACGTSDPGRLTAAGQRSVGTAYLAGAVHLFTGEQDEAAALFDGSHVRVASTGDSVVLSHAVGGGRDLRRPNADSGLTLATADTQFCLGVDNYGGPHKVCGRDTYGWSQDPHWPQQGELYPVRRALEVSWDAAGQVGGLALDEPLDLTGKLLELRTIVDPGVGDVELAVRLTDADGASADLTPSGGGTVAALPTGDSLSRRWAQTVTVDASAATLDASRITSIELVGLSAKGRVWVLDAAGVPATLPALVNRRIPLLSLGAVEVAEGDFETVTARVPFTVEGTVRTRSRFIVRTSGSDVAKASTNTIELSPGQTSGSIPVDIMGDDEPDLWNQSSFAVTAWGSLGIVTDDYQGQVTVIDDDPLPEITVKAVRGTVREGKQAKWKITMASPIGTEVWFDTKVLPGPAGVPALTGGDLPRKWRQWYVYPGTVGDPLYEQEVYLQTAIQPGKRSVVVSVPIRADGRKEGREQLTLQFTVNEQVYTQTVYVAASKG